MWVIMIASLNGNGICLLVTNKLQTATCSLFGLIKIRDHRRYLALIIIDAILMAQLQVGNSNGTRMKMKLPTIRRIPTEVPR